MEKDEILFMCHVTQKPNSSRIRNLKQKKKFFIGKAVKYLI